MRDLALCMIAFALAFFASAALFRVSATPVHRSAYRDASPIAPKAPEARAAPRAGNPL